MTTSDDDYLAPVINLFGDRSGTKHTEKRETASSSEESSAFYSSADVAETYAWADSPTDTRAYGDADAVAETEVGMDAEAPVVAVAPVRALPTMADFRSLQHDEHSREADAVQPEAEPVHAPSKAQRRQARDGFSELSRVSMRALARRGMSSHEMTQFLGTREFDSEDIDGEIERLESCGLLDDAALAETLTQTLRDRKKLGASAIRAELRRRKIDQEHISAVLDDDRDEEQERATEIALKRAPQLRSLDGVTAKRRLTGFLMRRGYSGAVVSAAVTAALAPGAGESSGGPVFR
ncbi:regulatory protein RecX [Rhodoglobus aureus]|uniref:Regulatory protein RecX n=1 Tax=Rhodoglobus aureus TaxID=191497 RepID=A0ABP4GN53_9MICO